MVRDDKAVAGKTPPCSSHLEKKSARKCEFRTQHVTTRDQRHELFNFNLKLKKHKLGRYPPTDSPATPVAARKSVVNASSQSKGDAMSSGTATVASRTLSPSLTRSPARFLFWTVPPPSFKGDIVTPDDPGYSGEIARWAVNAERPAGIVAFVKDTNDVARWSKPR